MSYWISPKVKVYEPKHYIQLSVSLYELPANVEELVIITGDYVMDYSTGEYQEFLTDLGTGGQLIETEAIGVPMELLRRSQKKGSSALIRTFYKILELGNVCEVIRTGGEGTSFSPMETFYKIFEAKKNGTLRRKNYPERLDD